MENIAIRPLKAADRDLLRDLPSRVSPDSAISRFHGALTALSEPMLDHLLNLDDGLREAVIAIVDEQIVGVARFARDAGADSAEVAFLVADEWQHRGLGAELMAELSARAQRAGITYFRADMLTENMAARHLIGLAGEVVSERVEAGGHRVVTVVLSG